MPSTILIILLAFLGLTCASAAEPLALVRDSDGKVATLIRPDLPAGYTAPAGFHLVPADKLPQGWQRIPPSAEDIAAAATLKKRDQLIARLTALQAEIAILRAGTGTQAVRMARVEADLADCIAAIIWLSKRELARDGVDIAD